MLSGESPKRGCFFVASGAWKIQREAGLCGSAWNIAPCLRVWFNLSVFGRIQNE
jgi:hypothetical protein